MRCVLVGNFGVGNLGDEALKDYFLERFPDVLWTVVSAHPHGTDEVARLPGGIRSFVSFRWIRTLVAYSRSNAVVFGGGSLFTDTESVYACVLWWLHAAVARLFRKPVHLAFQGIGPFHTRLGECLTTWVCRRSTSISVRDEASQKRVGDMVKNKKCVLSFDPIFSVIKNKKQDNSTNNVLMVIPRKNSSEKFSKKTQKLAESMTPAEVCILSMQPDEKSEIEFCQNLASSLKSNSPVQKIRTLNELVQCISSASFVISERYHGALAAHALKVPVKTICQSSHDKLAELDSEVSRNPDERITAGYCELAKYLVQ